MRLRTAPEALRPLPIRVRPHPTEAVASYIVRLARANHLRPSHLHAYLCGPPGWCGAPDLQRLAAVTGRPVWVLQRALTGPDVAATTGHAVARKVTTSGAIGIAGITYHVGSPFAGQIVQVTCTDGIVHISRGGQPLHAWPRRHPPAKDDAIQPDRFSDRGELATDHAARLAPLDDLATDPRVVRRRVDPTGAISFASRYYAAGRALTGEVVQVRCTGGIVQLIHGGRLVRAWRQRHAPEREQRMLQHPNPQQRTANTRPLTGPTHPR